MQCRPNCCTEGQRIGAVHMPDPLFILNFCYIIKEQMLLQFKGGLLTAQFWGKSHRVRTSKKFRFIDRDTEQR